MLPPQLDGAILDRLWEDHARFSVQNVPTAWNGRTDSPHPGDQDVIERGRTDVPCNAVPVGMASVQVGSRWLQSTRTAIATMLRAYQQEACGASNSTHCAEPKLLPLSGD